MTHFVSIQPFLMWISIAHVLNYCLVQSIAIEASYVASDQTFDCYHEELIAVL